MQKSPFARFDLSQRTVGERLVVWGIRTLVAERRAVVGQSNALDPVFVQFGVPDGVAPLERFLDILARAAHAQLLLHPVGCRCLSQGETDLLGTVASAQRGDKTALRADLARWLPRHALDWAEMPLLGFARTFAAAGLYVPTRPRVPVEHRWGAAAAGRPTLH